MADLEKFIDDNKDSINTTLFTSILDMMKSIESQINLQRMKRSQTSMFKLSTTEIIYNFHYYRLFNLQPYGSVKRDH